MTHQLPYGAIGSGWYHGKVQTSCEEWMMLNVLESIRANITLGEESGYVAECREIAIVTQGRTLDEVTLNLREAVALYFEGENPRELGFVDQPSLMITIELQPVYA